MATNKFIANSIESLKDAWIQCISLWDEHNYIVISVSTKRTLDQNAGIRVCYSQIRQHNEGWTVKYTERYCKLTYGVPVLREDPMHDYVFSNTLDKIREYEKRLLVMDCFSVTSEMTPEQASRMIESMKEDHPYIELKKPEE